jgi:hypothetical protein
MDSSSSNIAPGVRESTTRRRQSRARESSRHFLAGAGERPHGVTISSGSQSKIGSMKNSRTRLNGALSSARSPDVRSSARSPLPDAAHGRRQMRASVWSRTLLGDAWSMVDESMPSQLTVAELMHALREHQPDAVVGLKGVSDLKKVSGADERRLNGPLQPPDPARSVAGVAGVLPSRL